MSKSYLCERGLVIYVIIPILNFGVCCLQFPESFLYMPKYKPEIASINA
jgi:hypothetical protein